MYKVWKNGEELIAEDENYNDAHLKAVKEIGVLIDAYVDETSDLNGLPGLFHVTHDDPDVWEMVFNNPSWDRIIIRVQEEAT